MQIGVSSLPDRTPDPASADPGAQTSGAGFDRLVAAAQAEADRRKAIAAQSGANSDQFSEQGWFQIVKAHGAEIGLGAAANAITKGAHGELTVNDPVMRAKVVTYRNDPAIRAIMAVKRAADGRAVLTVELGRPPSDGEVRAAEAVGAKVAAKLIEVRQSTPYASAAIVAPDAAKANRAIFYRPDGSPQTVDEVMARLMKPTDAAATDADRLAAGHAAFAGPLPMPPGAGSQGLTPELATNLRAKAAFGTAATLQSGPVKPPGRPVAPPDLALVNGTIANLSMPGSSTGATAPTGGKISGWRGQMAGEVTHQVEHPESVVTHQPSNVTVPAPTRRPLIDQYAVVTPSAPVLPPALYARPDPFAAAATAAQPVTPAAAPTPSSTLLGARLAPVGATPQPSAALPELVTGGNSMPPTALPLLPIEDQVQPQQGLPQGVTALAAPAGASENAAPPVTSAPERPSRYGPRASLFNAAAPATILNYAATSPAPQLPLQSDASLAGIRPSRYFASAALATQQFASLNRGNPPVPQQSGVPIYAQPGTGQAATILVNGAQPIAAAPQVSGPDTVSVLGPNGVPILPPVPRPAGLPPITAEQALSGGAPLTETALLGGTKPLDLAPSAPAAALGPAAAPALPTNQRQRPRLTPAFTMGN